MARVGMAKGLTARSKERNSCLDVTAVGQHPGNDKTALDEDFPVHAGVPKLLPGSGNGFVPTQGPLAIRDHRVLVERSGEVVERPQLAGCLSPLAESVKRQSVKLAYGRHLRRQTHEHAQLCERFSVPVALVSPRGDRQPPFQPRRAIGAKRSAEFVSNLDRQLRVLGTLASAALPLGLPGCQRPRPS